MIGEYLWWCIYTTILTKVSVSDFESRIVYNSDCIILFGLGLMKCFYLANYSSLDTSAIILLAGFVLNYFSIIGGGDVKLLSAIAISIDPKYQTLTIIIIPFIGVIFMLIMYLAECVSKSDRKFTSLGVPYAIPICLGGFIGIFLSR